MPKKKAYFYIHLDAGQTEFFSDGQPFRVTVYDPDGAVAENDGDAQDHCAESPGAENGDAAGFERRGEAHQVDGAREGLDRRGAPFVDAISQRGWAVVNLDCTISAERPKLQPYKSQIRQRLAELLAIEPELVNVKANTGEQVGPVGREEAITADAVVLIARNDET